MLNFTNKQQGAFLIEALISMLLMAILVMGLTFVASRMLNANKQMSEHDFIVNDLRAKLLTHGAGANLCAGDIAPLTMPDASELTITAKNCDKTIPAKVNNVDVIIKSPLILTVINSQGQTVEVGANSALVSSD